MMHKSIYEKMKEALSLWTNTIMTDSFCQTKCLIFQQQEYSLTNLICMFVLL